MLKRLIRRVINRQFCIKQPEKLNLGAPEKLAHPLEQLREQLQSTAVDQDIETMRKMVYWKAGHLGVNEIEILVLKYLDAHMPDMNRQKLWAFYADVVERETDFLWRQLLGRPVKGLMSR